MNRLREAKEQHLSKARDYWFETQSRDNTHMSPLMHGITKESNYEDFFSLEKRRSIIEGTFGLQSNDKINSIFRNKVLGGEDLTYSSCDGIRLEQKQSLKGCESDFNIDGVNLIESEDFDLALQNVVDPDDLYPPPPPRKHYVEEDDNGSLLFNNPPPQNISSSTKHDDSHDDSRSIDNYKEEEMAFESPNSVMKFEQSKEKSRGLLLEAATTPGLTPDLNSLLLSNTLDDWFGKNVITSNEPQVISTNENNISSDDQGSNTRSIPQEKNLFTIQPLNCKASAKIESTFDSKRQESSSNDKSRIPVLSNDLQEKNLSIMKSLDCKMSPSSVSEHTLEEPSTRQTTSNQKEHKKENAGADIKDEDEQHSKILIKSNASPEPIEHSALQPRRIATWEMRFNEMKSFKEKYGHCNVPRSSGEYRELQTWIYNQRRRKSQLSRSKIQLLDNIGFRWKVRELVGWQNRYEQLQSWIETNGHNVKPNDKGLCEWMAKQRKLYALKNKSIGRRSSLTAEREAKMNHLGFVWSPSEENKVRNDKVWEKNFHLLKDFKGHYGHCRVPRGHKALGVWVMNQRIELKLYKKGKQSSINKKRKQLLESIDFS